MIKVNDNLYKTDKKAKKSNIIFMVVALVIVLITATIIVLNTFVFFMVEISGPSMWPTLNNEDVVVASKIKKAERGDIVIISGESTKYDGEGNAYQALIIKRVIALGGDTVEIKDGKVYINELLLDEPYLRDDEYTQAYNWVKRTLLDDEVFYLGDNRGNSMDSRSNYGTCKLSQIEGVVESWSLQTMGVTKFFHSIFSRG